MPKPTPTPDTPCVHPTYARLLCMLLRAQGADVEAALREAGLQGWSWLAISEDLLAPSAITRLVQAAVQACGKPWLGLELGMSAQISSHGALGYAAVASRDVRQALEVVARYASLRNDMLRYQLREEPSGLVLEITERFVLGGARIFLLETVFGAILRMIEAVAGQRLPQLVSELPFPEPPWRAEYARYCAGPLRFGAARLALRIDHATLALPCLTADPKAYAAACLECEQLLAQEAKASLATRVQEMLRAREGQYPSLEAVAAHFNVSQRTLIRHLKAGGTSYQALLDEARRQRAVWYLRNTDQPVEQIAARLGYQDTSNFSRTFRRWFGMTPGAAREAAQPPLA